jgi:hypothetical protein
MMYRELHYAKARGYEKLGEIEIKKSKQSHENSIHDEYSFFFILRVSKIASTLQLINFE